MSTPFEPIQIAEVASPDHTLEEAMHRFIDGNQLVERWQAMSSSRFVIGETRFGTGLNFLLTWSVWDRVAPPGARLHFISCEQHPLSLTALKQCLGLWPTLTDYAAALLEAYPVLTPGYHRLVFDEGRVILDLMLGDPLACYQERLLCGDPQLEKTLRRDDVDAWFLNLEKAVESTTSFYCTDSQTLFPDFSPHRMGDTISAKNQEKESVNQHINNSRYDSTAFSTLNGTACPAKTQSLIKPQTPWHAVGPHVVKQQEAIVIGAGLSGCLMAHALAQRGWQVRLLDQQSTVAQGASGNHRAILFPNVSAYRAPLTELMLSAFLYASRFYQQCVKRWAVGDFSGIFQFISAKKTDKTQADLLNWLAAYPELGRLVDAAAASELTGVDVSSGGLFIPMAGWMDSPALCAQLVQHPSIHFYPHTDASSLDKDSAGQWHVVGHTAEVVVIANGYAVNRFSQTKHLEIKAVRGQMTGVQASQHSQNLLIPLCGDGHILPQANGIHAIGATFGLYSEDARCTAADDTENHAKINALAAHLDVPHTIVSHWAGVRGAALDHLPLVGPVADAEAFKARFAGLASNAKRWIPSGGTYYEGLYMASGFGSRGLTTIPLCTEYLAGLINHEPSALPQRLVQAISPARFLRGDILRVKPNCFF